MLPESRPISPKHQELLKRHHIKLGAYSQDLNPGKFSSFVPIPADPHVFFTEELHLKSLQSGTTTILKGVMVIIAHGIFSDKNREWLFIGPNKPVKETVDAYDDVAEAMGWPRIDVVLACRGGSSTDELKENLKQEKLRGALVARPSLPLEISQLPHIFPGISSTGISGYWDAGRGGVNMHAENLEWLGIDDWRRYSESHQKMRSQIKIPVWAKNKAK